jgi:hypothetical protein
LVTGHAGKGSILCTLVPATGVTCVYIYLLIKTRNIFVGMTKIDKNHNSYSYRNEYVHMLKIQLNFHFFQLNYSVGDWSVLWGMSLHRSQAVYRPLIQADEHDIK